MNPNLLPDLATFVLIIEQGSLSAAAKASGATPSAISRSASRLEKALGSKLLHRTTRKLALSETGKIVYAHAQEMLHAAQMAVDSGSSRQTIAQGQLTLSVPKAVGRFVIHPLMAEFFARYPQVDVCLRLEDRYMDLIDDGVDLALRISQSPSPGPVRETADAGQSGYAQPPNTYASTVRPSIRRHCASIAVSVLARHLRIHVGSFDAVSAWRPFRLMAVTPPTTPAGLDAVKKDLGIAARHCSPPARHSPMARLSRYCQNGNLSATTAGNCGCYGRAIDMCCPSSKGKVVL